MGLLDNLLSNKTIILLNLCGISSNFSQLGRNSVYRPRGQSIRRYSPWFCRLPVNTEALLQKESERTRLTTVTTDTDDWQYAKCLHDMFFYVNYNRDRFQIIMYSQLTCCKWLRWVGVFNLSWTSATRNQLMIQQKKLIRRNISNFYL